MKCPFCGGEMEQGVLQGGGGHDIGWREKPSVFPNLLNAQWLGTGDWKYHYLSALRCPRCRKIIVNY